MPRKITQNELKEAIQSALDNWDFGQCTIYGAEQKEALEYALEDPAMLCEDGEYEISGKDVWDSLSIYAEATAINIVDRRAHY